MKQRAAGSVSYWDSQREFGFKAPENYTLGHCSKKKFIGITLFSENEYYIFLLIIYLPTSVHTGNSVILLILLILAGVKVYLFFWSQGGFQDLGIPWTYFFSW